MDQQYSFESQLQFLEFCEGTPLSGLMKDLPKHLPDLNIDEITTELNNCGLPGQPKHLPVLDPEDIEAQLNDSMDVPVVTPQLQGPSAPDVEGCGSKKCQCWNCKNGVPKKPVFHTCDRCDSKFTKASKLEEHVLRNHLKIRPFQCDRESCSKAFYRKDELQRHIRTHTQERNYTCSVCLKKFMRSDHLSNHFKLHTRLPQNQFLF